VDVDVEAVETRLAQVEARPVGIVGALRQFGVEIPLAGPDRVVVAQRAVAVEDRVDQLLAVDRVFQRQPHVHVVERRRRVSIGKP
jgi:hypothetical protein